MVERENGLALSVENQYEKGEELSKYPEWPMNIFYKV